MGKVLGIDQGISSVGWGIIDTDTNEIVDAGVRLFSEADKANNEGRRLFRGGRRLKRRRAHRKERLVLLLKDNDLYSTEDISSLNPYECRVKGLTQKLTLPELNSALFNIIKHRGSSLETVDDNSNNVDSTKFQLANNDSLLKDRYVCQVQLERLEKDGKVRGISNNFRTSDYLKELKQILSNQSIKDHIVDQILDIIFKRRHFSDGPGSIKSQTPYGKIYKEDGTIIDMIEKMTGHCSIYPDELRAPKRAPSAELFNLLNDLNNLKVNDEKIDIELKQQIIHYALEKGSLTPKKIATILGYDLSSFTGFRVDKNFEPIVTELVGYKIFKKIFEENGIILTLDDFELLDNISVILTKTKVIQEREIEIFSLVNDEKIASQLSVQNKFTGYHSFSLKAIRIINEEMFNSQDNQMQILSQSGKLNQYKIGSQKGKKKISVNDNAVLSPVALRSYRQAIKVINEARKKYGEFESIVIETTRDKNSKEEKNRIKEFQRYNQERKDLAKKRIEDYPNVELNGKLIDKLVLYEQQQAKTGYTQETINIDLLITDPTAYEIDHIIPISVSLDDSFNNKTLVSRTENQSKGNLSPLMAFDQNKFNNGNIERYKVFIKSLFDRKLINRKKYENYMYAKDINKYDNMKDFIARNLVDTSYANRLLLNTLQDYFRDNDIHTTVHTVKGFATNRFRKFIKLEKDRDEDNSHHAIDALLVASIKKMSIYREVFSKYDLSENGVIYNRNTGDVIENIKDALANEDDIRFLKKIEKYKVSKYSRMIDTKPNRSIADQTIYSTRTYNDEEYVIRKYSNIYDKKFCNLANDIVNNAYKEKYLIAKHDPQTMQTLIDIVNHYYSLHKEDKDYVSIKKDKIEFKINPLYEYLEQTGEYIKKYSNKGNGPIIKSVKFVDGRLGSHIDISNNYNVKDKKVVLQQISSFRTDFYLCPDNRYRFVTIRYRDVKFVRKKGLYVIDEEWYKNEKIKKQIDNTSNFVFSMHHGELLYIEDEKRKGIYTFVATKADDQNVIELHTLDGHNEGRITPTIGKKTVLLKKYASTALGDLIQIKDSKLKLAFK